MAKYKVQYKDPDRYVEDENGNEVNGDIPDDVRSLAPEYLMLEVDTEAKTVTVLKGFN